MCCTLVSPSKAKLKVAAALTLWAGLHVIEHATERAKALLTGRAAVVLPTLLVALAPVLLATAVEGEKCLPAIRECTLRTGIVLPLAHQRVRLLASRPLSGARSTSARLKVLRRVAHGAVHLAAAGARDRALTLTVPRGRHASGGAVSDGGLADHIKGGRACNSLIRRTLVKLLSFMVPTCPNVHRVSPLVHAAMKAPQGRWSHHGHVHEGWKIRHEGRLTSSTRGGIAATCLDAGGASMSPRSRSYTTH